VNISQFLARIFQAGTLFTDTNTLALWAHKKSTTKKKDFYRFKKN